MAIANYAAFKNAAPYASISTGKGSYTTSAGRMLSSWTVNPFAGSTPSAAAACNGATVGSHTRGMLSGVATYLKVARQSRVGAAGILFLDRLSHQGGLSGTSVATQTTNLPTAALTRYTSGVGVMAFVEIYTTVGTTASTLSCSYTNSAGTAGRTSPALQFGGTGDRTLRTIIPIPLQVGDVGVKSVESVTLSISTGTVGDFGITLAKPLFAIPGWEEAQQFTYDGVKDLGASFESIAADACLMSVVLSITTDSLGRSGSLDLIKQ